MEKNCKFRNHISVIFEKAIKIIGLLIFMFLGSFLSDINEIKVENLGKELLVLFLVIFGSALVVLGGQLIIWSRTYISIQENTLVVERNTLNKKKNTIGIKNISNINLEQNLFQMLIGTCRVKVDTNSLSTADKTDVTFILKKKEAEIFRQMILLKEETKKTEEPSVKNETRKLFVSDLENILMHGVFSIPLVWLFMFVSVLGILIGAFGMFGQDISENILEIFASALMVFWILVGWLWNIVKGFFKYIDFRIERIEDKIFLNYGLFKQVAYSIPVNKINAIRFSQGLLARICNQYMVEVINVGMDDDANEAYSFLLPYAKKETIERQIKVLLPEFEECLEMQDERQPKCIWLLWIPVVAIVIGIFGVVVVITGEILGETVPNSIFIIGILAILSVMFLTKCGEYFTAGCVADDKLLKITQGVIGKRSTLIKYEKIQFITVKQNVLAKYWGIQKGEIQILAALKNRVHLLPYVREEILEKIKTNTLK